jgi:PAS domain S-box-containing protein
MFEIAGIRRYEKYKDTVFWSSLLAAVLIALYVNLYLGIDIVYTHLFYIPIILAGLWYPRRAVLVALFLGLLHVSVSYFGAPSTIPHSLIRACILIAVAIVVSALAESKDSLNRSLGEANKRSSSIIEFYPDPTLIIDNDGLVIAWNRAMEDMTGIKAAEMIGKGNHEYSLPFYGEKKMMLLNMLDMPAGEIETRYKDVTMHDGLVEATSLGVKVRGRDVKLWGIASRLYGADGQPIGAIESVRDVTSQKLMEAKLQQQHRELEEHHEELKKRQAELSHANEELNRVYADLKSSEEKYRLIMASVNDAILTMSLDGQLEFVNARMQEITGYTQDELLGHHFTEFIPEEHRETTMQLFSSGVSGTRVPPTELEIVTRPGSRIPIEMNCSYLRDSGEKIAGIIVAIRDITGRKRADEALRQAHNELERRVIERTAELEQARTTLAAILDTIPAGVMVADASTGMISYANNSAIAIFGDRLVGHDSGARDQPYSLIGPDGCTIPPDDMPLMRSLMDGRHTRDYEILMRHSGGEKSILLSSAPVRDADGRITSAVVSAVDITERKRIESALRESEQKFRVLAETMPAAIFIFQNGRFIYVNKATEKITGYTRDELLAMNFWDWIHPDYKKLVREHGYSRRHGLPVPARYEVMYVTKGGEEGWVEIMPGLIEYEGKPATIATAMDITERKQSEEALKDAKEHAEIYIDLLSHDINNMNQVAIGYLELAQGSENAGDARKFISRALEMLKGSSALIDTVRKIQQAVGGSLKLEPVDLGEILCEAVSESPAMPGREINIRYERVSGRHVMANRLLKDIFSNMIGNAIKHSEGRLDVSVEVVDLMEHDRLLYRVAVEDDGPGIPDEMKEKVFSRLNRGYTKASGSGLGLYLVKMLVKSFKGHVWVEDRVAGDYTKGSRFIVLLPSTDKSPVEGNAQIS